MVRRVTKNGLVRRGLIKYFNPSFIGNFVINTLFLRVFKTKGNELFEKTNKQKTHQQTNMQTNKKTHQQTNMQTNKRTRR